MIFININFNTIILLPVLIVCSISTTPLGGEDH